MLDTADPDKDLVTNIGYVQRKELFCVSTENAPAKTVALKSNLTTSISSQKIPYPRKVLI